MHIVLEADRLGIEDAGDLKCLGASRVADVEPPPTLARIDPDGLHCWIVIQELRSAAGLDQTPDWHRRFDEMIDFALRSGWVDSNRTVVRAHLGDGAP